MAEEAEVLIPSEEEDPAQLTYQRIRELAADPELPGAYGEWVKETAAFLAAAVDGKTLTADSETAKTGAALISESPVSPCGDPLTEAFSSRWLDYEYAKEQAGECGQMLCFLRSELLTVPIWVQEGSRDLADAYAELFLLIAGSMAAELADGIDGKLLAESLQETIASMYWDFLELFFEEIRRNEACALPISLNPKGRQLVPEDELSKQPSADDEGTDDLNCGWLSSHSEDAAVYLDRAWMERFLELAAGQEKGRLRFEEDFLDALTGMKKESSRPVFGTKQMHLLEQMKKRLAAL